MILDVDPDAGSVGVIDPHVLTRFHVAVHGRSEDSFDGVDTTVRSAGAGRLSGREVLVSIEWLRRRAAASAAVGWEERYDEMVELSTTKGWVEQRPADGADPAPGGPAVPSLRVHCEWPAEPKFVALDFCRTVLREHRWRDGLERYADAAVVAHGPGRTPDLVGRESVVADLERNRVADCRLQIHHVISDGEMVAVHALLHTPAASPEGMSTVDIFRVSGVRIAEWWRVRDTAPVPGPAAG